MLITHGMYCLSRAGRLPLRMNETKWAWLQRRQAQKSFLCCSLMSLALSNHSRPRGTHSLCLLQHSHWSWMFPLHMLPPPTQPPPALNVWFQEIFLCVHVQRELHRLFYASEYVYKSWGVLLHMWKKKVVFMLQSIASWKSIVGSGYSWLPI